MKFSVVISTIGKSPYLAKSLASLGEQSVKPCEVVVVDQSGGAIVQQVVEGAAAQGIPVVHAVSSRGLSIGRNTGLKSLTKSADVVAFMDDDCTFPPRLLESLADVFAETGADVVSGVVETNGKRRVAFGEDSVTVTRANVWTRTIEGATFYRKDALDKAGYFDETLGAGAPTKWQSGEGTDLLIRVLDAGGKVVFDPSLVVLEHQEDIRHADYLKKVRAYARGTGRVYRKWYPIKDQVLVVLKPLAAACVFTLKRKPQAAAQKWQAALGRVEGMIGPAR